MADCEPICAGMALGCGVCVSASWHVQAHARMAGELGEPGTDGEAEAEAGRDRSDGQSRGQYITVSLKPGVAQVQL